MSLGVPQAEHSPANTYIHSISAVCRPVHLLHPRQFRQQRRGEVKHLYQHMNRYLYIRVYSKLQRRLVVTTVATLMATLQSKRSAYIPGCKCYLFRCRDPTSALQLQRGGVRWMRYGQCWRCAIPNEGRSKIIEFVIDRVVWNVSKFSQVVAVESRMNLAE